MFVVRKKSVKMIDTGYDARQNSPGLYGDTQGTMLNRKYIGAERDCMEKRGTSETFEGVEVGEGHCLYS